MMVARSTAPSWNTRRGVESLQAWPARTGVPVSAQRLAVARHGDRQPPLHDQVAACSTCWRWGGHPWVTCIGAPQRDTLQAAPRRGIGSPQRYALQASPSPHALHSLVIAAVHRHHAQVLRPRNDLQLLPAHPVEVARPQLAAAALLVALPDLLRGQRQAQR